MIRKILKNKFLYNLSWIFFGNIAHAVFSFLLSVFAGRILTNNDYGLVNYAASWIAFFNAICSLGINGIITKKFAEDEAAASEYLGTAIKLRFAVAVISATALQILIALLNTEEPILKTIVFWQSLTILFGAFDVFMYWFRYKNEAKIVAIVCLEAFFISGIARMVVLFTSRDVVSFVAMGSLESIIFGIVLLCKYKTNNRIKLTFSKEKAREMLQLSYPFIFSALLATIYGQTDKIMLKMMLDNESVAAYSVALLLAGMISIIPAALIEGFRPEVMKYKIADEDAYQRRMKQLYASVFWICIAFCLFVTFFAKYIVLILYGEKYRQAIPVLSLVVWYTTFSYFGAINNLYFVAEDKVKWVQVTTLLGAVLNIVLNFILIPVMGTVGAALASLVTQFTANFILLAIVPQLRDCFKIIMQGIMLRGIR